MGDKDMQNRNSEDIQRLFEKMEKTHTTLIEGFAYSKAHMEELRKEQTKLTEYQKEANHSLEKHERRIKELENYREAEERRDKNRNDRFKFWRDKSVGIIISITLLIFGTLLTYIISLLK